MVVTAKSGTGAECEHVNKPDGGLDRPGEPWRAGHYGLRPAVHGN